MLAPELLGQEIPSDTGIDVFSDAPASPREPGSLRGGVSITLHTRQAVQLFEGRRPAGDKPGIPGLYRFDKLLDRIAVGSVAGDPHADWCLVRIERCLDSLGPVLTKEHLQLSEQMKPVEGLSVTVAASTDPRIEMLKLRAPHAFLAARLIVEFDLVVKHLLTLVHIGMIDPRERGLRIGRLQYRVRRPFNLAEHYWFSGVTRQDVLEGNERAREAARSRARLSWAVVGGVLAPRFPLRPKRMNEAQKETKGEQTEPPGNEVGTSCLHEKTRVSA